VAVRASPAWGIPVEAAVERATHRLLSAAAVVATANGDCQRLMF
jgi:hypothetical protein